MKVLLEILIGATIITHSNVIDLRLLLRYLTIPKEHTTPSAKRPPPEKHCNFDDRCGFTTETTANNGDGWRLVDASTFQTQRNRLPVDSIVGNTTGTFWYLQAQHPTRAELASPTIDLEWGVGCIMFFYRAVNCNVSLSVEIWPHGRPEEVTPKYDTKSGWELKAFDVDLNRQENYKFVIVAQPSQVCNRMDWLVDSYSQHYTHCKAPRKKKCEFDRFGSSCGFTPLETSSNGDGWIRGSAGRLTFGRRFQVPQSILGPRDDAWYLQAAFPSEGHLTGPVIEQARVWICITFFYKILNCNSTVTVRFDKLNVAEELSPYYGIEEWDNGWIQKAMHVDATRVRTQMKIIAKPSAQCTQMDLLVDDYVEYYGNCPSPLRKSCDFQDKCEFWTSGDNEDGVGWRHVIAEKANEGRKLPVDQAILALSGQFWYFQGRHPKQAKLSGPLIQPQKGLTCIMFSFMHVNCNGSIKAKLGRKEWVLLPNHDPRVSKVWEVKKLLVKDIKRCTLTIEAEPSAHCDIMECLVDDYRQYSGDCPTPDAVVKPGSRTEPMTSVNAATSTTTKQQTMTAVVGSTSIAITTLRLAITSGGTTASTKSQPTKAQTITSTFAQVTTHPSVVTAGVTTVSTTSQPTEAQTIASTLASVTTRPPGGVTTVSTTSQPTEAQTIASTLTSVTTRPPGGVTTVSTTSQPIEAQTIASTLTSVTTPPPEGPSELKFSITGGKYEYKPGRYDVVILQTNVQYTISCNTNDVKPNARITWRTSTKVNSVQKNQTRSTGLTAGSFVFCRNITFVASFRRNVVPFTCYAHNTVDERKNISKTLKFRSAFGPSAVNLTITSGRYAYLFLNNEYVLVPKSPYSFECQSDSSMPRAEIVWNASQIPDARQLALTHVTQSKGDGVLSRREIVFTFTNSDIKQILSCHARNSLDSGIPWKSISWTLTGRCGPSSLTFNVDGGRYEFEAGFDEVVLLPRLNYTFTCLTDSVKPGATIAWNTVSEVNYVQSIATSYQRSGGESLMFSRNITLASSFQGQIYPFTCYSSNDIDASQYRQRLLKLRNPYGPTTLSVQSTVGKLQWRGLFSGKYIVVYGKVHELIVYTDYVYPNASICVDAPGGNVSVTKRQRSQLHPSYIISRELTYTPEVRHQGLTLKFQAVNTFARWHKVEVNLKLEVLYGPSNVTLNCISSSTVDDGEGWSLASGKSYTFGCSTDYVYGEVEFEWSIQGELKETEQNTVPDEYQGRIYTSFMQYAVRERDTKVTCSARNAKSNSKYVSTTKSILRPVDGGWSEWATWSKCNASCDSGTGSVFRNRTCDDPVPYYGGNYCWGQGREVKTCSAETRCLDVAVIIVPSFGGGLFLVIFTGVLIVFFKIRRRSNSIKTPYKQPSPCYIAESFLKQSNEPSPTYCFKKDDGQEMVLMDSIELLVKMSLKTEGNIYEEPPINKKSDRSQTPGSNVPVNIDELIESASHGDLKCSPDSEVKTPRSTVKKDEDQRSSKNSFGSGACEVKKKDSATKESYSKSRMKTMKGCKQITIMKSSTDTGNTWPKRRVKTKRTRSAR